MWARCPVSLSLAWSHRFSSCADCLVITYETVSRTISVWVIRPVCDATALRLMKGSSASTAEWGVNAGDHSSVIPPSETTRIAAWYAHQPTNYLNEVTGTHSLETRVPSAVRHHPPRYPWLPRNQRSSSGYTWLSRSYLCYAWLVTEQHKAAPARLATAEVVRLPE